MGADQTPALPRIKAFFFILITSGLVFGFTLALDRALGCLGYPREVGQCIVGPPHYKLSIDNLEYQYTLRTNDQGIRYRTVPLVKGEGLHRIVLLGDSFTEGTGVKVDDRWSNLLEQRLLDQEHRSIELINCGEAGTEPLDYGRTLFHIGLKYQPDGVLICLYYNDVTNTPPVVDPARMFPSVARRTGIKKAAHALWPHTYIILKSVLQENARPQTQGLLNRFRGDLVSVVRSEVLERGIDEERFRLWVDSVPDEMVSAANAGKINAVLLTNALIRPEYFRESLDLDTERARAKWRSVCRVLRTICDECRKRGIEVGMVLLPSVYQYDPRSCDRLRARLYARLGSPMRKEWLTERTRLEREVEKWAATNGVPFLDLCPAFRVAVRRSDEALNYEIDMHWTPAGNRIAVEVIHEWLKEAGVFSFLAEGDADGM